MVSAAAGEGGGGGFHHPQSGEIHDVLDGRAVLNDMSGKASPHQDRSDGQGFAHVQEQIHSKIG